MSLTQNIFPGNPKHSFAYDFFPYCLLYKTIILFERKSKMKATKIKMKAGCARSNNTTEISEVYLEGCTNPGYYTKESLHDYLKKNPGSIQVSIYPYPNVVPALSSRQEKYVRSDPNDTPNDNLLKLPRV